MRLSRIALTTFAFLVAPAIAAAEDCIDKPLFSPPRGTSVPPYPTIFVTMPRPRLTEFHTEHPHRTTTVESSEYFTMVRVDLAVAGGKPTMAVSGDTRRIYFSEYEIGEAAPSFVEITGVLRSDDHTVEITGTGNPIALRFAWDDGRETLVPTQQHRDVFVAQLGNVPCIGWNISQERLAELHSFALYAVYVDGSQERIGVAKLQIADSDLVMPTNLVHEATPRAAAPQVALPPPPIPTTIIQRAPWPGWSGALGGFAVVLGAGFLRRRRRNHTPRYR